MRTRYVRDDGRRYPTNERRNQNVTYRFVPHTADVKVELVAGSLEELFRDAARLVRELVAGSAPVRSTEERAVGLKADEPAELLLGFLQELFYQFAVDAFVPGDVTFRRLSPTELEARVHGEPFDAARHETQPEVKAVTRHGLLAEQTSAGWRAEVLFDV